MWRLLNCGRLLFFDCLDWFLNLILIVLYRIDVHLIWLIIAIKNGFFIFSLFFKLSSVLESCAHTVQIWCWNFICSRGNFSLLGIYPAWSIIESFRMLLWISLRNLIYFSFIDIILLNLFTKSRIGRWWLILHWNVLRWNFIWLWVSGLIFFTFIAWVAFLIRWEGEIIHLLRHSTLLKILINVQFFSGKLLLQ